MNTTLREGELQISLPKSVEGRKFDDETHGLSHCMKAVDWIIDLPDKVYMVEVKDLDARGASGREERRRYLDDLEAGRKDRDFVAKFRDSFIYQWAHERVDKPIVYLVVMACETPAQTTLRIPKRLETGNCRGRLGLQRKDLECAFPQLPNGARTCSVAPSASRCCLKATPSTEADIAPE